ncbi:MAG: S41 family peptidase [Saprospiraceae bacterium]|nr:S41 family peptidase [Saprospiraceae bacterium]
MKKIALISVLGILTSAFFIDYNKHFEIAKNIEIFANVYKEINAHYVDETDPAGLMKAGIDAMLHQLDPFTNYISEVQIENYRLVYEGKYNGMGARAKKIGDYVTITEVYKDYPADKAGLKVGDQVTEVNGLDGKGKDSEDLFHMMRGIPKSEVELTISRPGNPDKLKLKLVRDEVNIPNVPYSGKVNDSIGYIILTTFTENAGKNVRDAFKKLKSENPDLKGIILDLRDNGGGLLHEAVEVCNVFIPQGQLVSTTRSKFKEKDQAYNTRQQPEDANIPLVTLINGKSASASEIVSGTFQDLDRGVILGQISYGKGLVQNTKEVGYNAKVKLTIAKYYIPSGRCIQSVKYENGEPVHLPDSLRIPFKTKNGRTVFDGGGVKPDIEVSDANYPEIVQKLLDQDHIFNYCTQYLMKENLPHDYKNYQYNDYQGFKIYLKNQNFKDNNEFRKKLEELENLSKQDKYQGFENQLTQLKTQAEQWQWEILDNHKDLINNIIEEEIAGRAGYREAIIQKRMDHDPVVLSALEILGNREKYKRILTKP